MPAAFSTERGMVTCPFLPIFASSIGTNPPSLIVPESREPGKPEITMTRDAMLSIRVSPSAFLIEYHERSKHRLRRYAPGPGGLDWANKPDPFRTFEGAARFPLALAADTLATRYD